MESKKSMKTSLRGGANSLALRPAWRAAAFAFVSVCAAAWTAAADALSLAIDGTTATVSAEAGALDSTSKLYLVWDVADHGEVLFAWPEGKRLEYEGTFDGSAATCNFDISSIPVGSAVRAISTVDGVQKLVGGYVSNPSSSYFDTGVLDTEACSVEIKFQATSFSGNWNGTFGSNWTGFGLGQRYASNSFYIRYRDHDVEVFETTTTAMQTFAITNNVATFSGDKMTTTKYAINTTQGLGTSGYSILLGSSWETSSQKIFNTWTAANWYYAKFFDKDGKLIANFVPALYGESNEAVLYDTVSKKCIHCKTLSGGDAIAGYDTSASTTEVDSVSPAAFTGKTAYWTGNGVKTNVNDQDNWDCKDASGATVSGAYPDLQTKVVIQGETDFNIPAGQTLACYSLDIQNCSLKTDCDWSGLASINAYSTLDVLQYVDVPTTVYIDTGFKPNQNTRVVMDATVLGTMESWFGVTDDTSGNWWKTKVFGVSNDGGGVYSGYGNQGGTQSPAVSNGRHTVELDKNVLKIDGVKHDRTNWSAATFQLANNLWLFKDNKGGVAQNVKNGSRRFHSCKIYDDGTLVRDFVPVKKPDGTVCLFDRKNREFYYNGGTGSFTASAGTTGEKVYYSGEVGGTIDGMVDLAGHALTLANFAGSGTVTDTSATGGELRVAPAEENKTVENAELTLAGSLKLVKNGKGTFVATKTGHSYTGGTIVADGVLKCGAGAYGRYTPLGQTNAVVTVQNGGVLEMNGNNGYDQNIFILDGGIMKNSGSSANDSNTCWSNVVLTADSKIVINASYGFISGGHGATSLDLGGHTLHVSVADGKTFWVYGTTIENGGTLDVAGGCVKFGRSGKSNTAVNARKANITVNAKIEAAYGDVPVNNYTAQYNTDGNAGDYKFLVNGVFKPAAGGYFHGCEMQDGSIIDFTGRTERLNAVSSFSGGNKTLSFANGTITIKIDPKADWIKTLARNKDATTGEYNGLLVDWTDSTSKPGDGVEFTLDAGGDTRYRIEKTAAGLVIYPIRGFAVIVR